MKRLNDTFFAIEFEKGTSQGKTGFWAPKDKYPFDVLPILGIEVVDDSNRINLLKGANYNYEIPKIYCLCENYNLEKRNISLFCSPSRLPSALEGLRNKIIYNEWRIVDVFLKYSDVPDF